MKYGIENQTGILFLVKIQPKQHVGSAHFLQPRNHQNLRRCTRHKPQLDVLDAQCHKLTQFQKLKSAVVRRPSCLLKISRFNLIYEWGYVALHETHFAYQNRLLIHRSSVSCKHREANDLLCSAQAQKLKSNCKKNVKIPTFSIMFQKELEIVHK